MGMKLTADQLLRLAGAVQELEKVRVMVRTFEFEGHGIMLERVDDQRDGTRLIVRGITDRPAGMPGHGGHGAVHRGGSD